MFPLTPYKPQKSRMDGLSGKNFSAALSFPTIRRFESCVLPAVLKKRHFFASLSNTELLKICQKWTQKSSKSFSDLLLCVPLRGGGIFSFHTIG